MWTPAEGCLLINGVIPPESCVGIPDVGHQLEDPITGASEDQLVSAKRLLQEYHWRLNWSRRQFRDWKTRSTDDLVSPSDFLRWCSDIGRNPLRPIPLFPEFIRHVECGEGLHPFRQTVEEEISTLENAAFGEKFLKIQIAANASEDNGLRESRSREPRHAAPVVSTHPAPSGFTPPVRDKGLTTLEKQIRAILAGVAAKGWDRKRIPDKGKKEIFEWCQENTDLFGGKSYKQNARFADAWKAARQDDLVAMENLDRFSRR